jgi:hypothetical protein
MTRPPSRRPPVPPPAPRRGQVQPTVPPPTQPTPNPDLTETTVFAAVPYSVPTQQPVHRDVANHRGDHGVQNQGSGGRHIGPLGRTGIGLAFVGVAAAGWAAGNYFVSSWDSQDPSGSSGTSDAAPRSGAPTITTAPQPTETEDPSTVPPISSSSSSVPIQTEEPSSVEEKGTLAYAFDTFSPQGDDDIVARQLRALIGDDEIITRVDAYSYTTRGPGDVGYDLKMVRSGQYGSLVMSSDSGSGSGVQLQIESPINTRDDLLAAVGKVYELMQKEEGDHSSSPSEPGPVLTESAAPTSGAVT